jgi:hypothetical protein
MMKLADLHSRNGIIGARSQMIHAIKINVWGYGQIMINGKYLVLINPVRRDPVQYQIT